MDAIEHDDLICPDCRTPLTPIGTSVRCLGCSREFPLVFDRVLSLVPERQEMLKSQIMEWWSANNMDMDWRRAHPEFEKGSWE